MDRRRHASPPADPGADAKIMDSFPHTLPTPYEAFSDSARLIESERDDLAACEAAIDTLRVAFWAAGKALQVIRDGRLYRGTHPTFEDYCEDRWQMSRASAYRLMQEWPLAEALSPIGDTRLNEGQVRELIPLASRYGQDAAVTAYQAVADTDGVKVTAAVLKGVVDLFSGDRFDHAEATEQIRSYLAGQAIPEPSTIGLEAAFFAEANRLCATVRRAVNRPAFQAALRERPEDARAVVKELRQVLDDVEAAAQQNSR